MVAGACQVISAAFALVLNIPTVHAQTMAALIVLDCTVALRACARTPGTMLLMERGAFSFLMSVWFAFVSFFTEPETRDGRSSALFFLVCYDACKPEPRG